MGLIQTPGGLGKLKVGELLLLSHTKVGELLLLSHTSDAVRPKFLEIFDARVRN
jgi:hypothetical protein